MFVMFTYQKNYNIQFKEQAETHEMLKLNETKNIRNLSLDKQWKLKRVCLSGLTSLVLYRSILFGQKKKNTNW